MEAVERARAHGAEGEAEPISDAPWARVSRIGDLRLKECRPVQAYEVRLTVALAWRWQDRVPPVRAADPVRGRLPLADGWLPRLRAAYLEPWGKGLDAARQVAAFARLLQWERIGDTEPLERNLRTFLETVVAT